MQNKCSYKLHYLKKTLSRLAVLAHLRVFIWKIFISAKSCEISPRRTGSSYERIILRKARSHLGEIARLTEPAHLHMNSPLISFVIKVLLERKTKLLHDPNWHYMLKVNNRNIRARYEIYSKARRKTTEQYYWRRSGALTVNFKHVLHFILLIWLLTLSM